MVNPRSKASELPPSVQVSLASGDDQDKLSDYVPESGDLSRAPTASASVSRVASKAPSEDKDEADDEDEEMKDAENDGQTNGDSSVSKSARQLEKAKEKEHLKAQRSEAREAKSAKMAAQAQGLNSARSAVNRSKGGDSLKRFSYLLGQTELFQHFVDLRKDRDPEFAKLLEESEQKNKKGKGRAGKGGAAAGGNRRRKTEKEEDEELLGNNDEEEEEAFIFEESPPYVKGGKMRDYQVQGLNWMISLYHNGINGILADEMGLGKTLQTISFLGYLREYRDTPGFHLVVVPKSTLDNWAREFEKWVPGFRVVTLTGDQAQRRSIIEDYLLTQNFDVLLTTYEMCLREKGPLKKLSWEYIVIDEAHRIKNVDSILSKIVREFVSRSRLLITGTPLQNNLSELWALLNFLLPDVFAEVSDFDSWFKEKGEENQDQVVQQLHKVLRPFLLRRVKIDVEKSLLPKKEINVFVDLTAMQRKWYKSLLEKDIDAVNGAGGKKEGKTRLLNIVMQLRKCCNHPYLFDGAEPGPPFTTDEHLVENSGKMLVLDKLLKRMKEKGSRVLIFSQMSRMLDILEDYCQFREYQYCRIDGSTAHEDRITAIDNYNAPGSEKFVFLLTTRAGGLGINLTTADIVVLFDSDWNPQADLQAMDRAHRIGQTKQVFVFRFVTEHAVEERILDRAAQKLRLDQLVIQQGRAQGAQKAAQNKEDLVDMIQHGAERIINTKDDSNANFLGDIDEIIKRGEQRTQELQEKYSGANLDDLNNFKSETALQWEGTDFGQKRKLNTLWIEPSKRERKANYNMDSYYRDAMRTTAKPAGPKVPRAPKQITAQEWQFYPPRLVELQARETAAYQASIGYKVPAREPKPGEKAEDVEAERAKLQAAISEAEPLTEEEAEEREQLSELGFPEWTKRDFTNFIKGCERFGRTAFSAITDILEGTKTEEEVRRYSKVFWERHHELQESDRIVARIEDGEKKRHKQALNEASLRRKVNEYVNPLQSMRIQYSQAGKGKSYSEEEDRFLLVRLAEYGLGGDEIGDRIKKDINEYAGFRFDWFIKSRTPAEISRRCTTLLGLLLKDDEDASITKPGRKTGAGAKRVASEAFANGNTSRGSTPGGATNGKKSRK